MRQKIEETERAIADARRREEEFNNELREKLELLHDQFDQHSLHDCPGDPEDDVVYTASLRNYL